MREMLTTKYCRNLYKLATLFIFLIQFSAILESPSAYVHTHHMEAYLCHVPPGMESVFETYLNHTGEDCYYPDDPDFPGHFCESIAYGWAIGGEVCFFF